jgi:hypothetical protein
MEDARGIVEAPIREEEVGMMKGFGMQTGEAVWVERPMREDEEFWMVEGAMEPMTEAKVGVEANARRCPRRHP